MKELSKNELRRIQGGYESFWVKCTRAFGYAFGSIMNTIEDVGHNSAKGGCRL